MCYHFHPYIEGTVISFKNGNPDDFIEDNMAWEYPNKILKKAYAETDTIPYIVEGPFCTDSKSGKIV